jgi:hypothetical protein
VRLSEEVKQGDAAFAYGYPGANIYGDPVDLTIEGRFPVTGMDKSTEALKLSKGQILSGISGAPLLNKRTGLVCGIVKRTRNLQFDLGGYAISASTARQVFAQLAPAFALPPAPDLDAMLASFYDPPLSPDDQGILAKALFGCPKFSTQSGREQLIGQLPAELQMNISLTGNPLAQITTIIEGCLQAENGLSILFQRLAFFDGGKISYKQLCKTVESVYEKRRQADGSTG